ncbi:MAG: cytochrome c biogenesis protein CcdA [Pseudomonadota bacterium]
MTSELTLLTTVFAGLLSFLSPCVLPLVPPYLTYLAGSSLDELTGEQDSRTIRNRALGNAVFFVFGFTCVFVALGAGASTFSQVIRQNQDVLSTIAGIIIIAMGLHFLGVFRFALMYREARVQVSPEITRSATAAGAFIMGLAFAFGWTPCIGPILGVILGMASTSDTVGEGAFLLGVYSLGLGIPFILAALFAGPFLRFLQRFRRHLGTVERLMGVLLVLTGIAFLTGGMQAMAFWLLETFQALQQLG